MKTRSIATIALAALTLTACGSAEQETTNATSAAATPSPTKTATTPKTTPSPSYSQYKTKKTTYTGAIITGEDVTFEIFPPIIQDKINDELTGTGLKGSWGAICSVPLSTEQLLNYSVQTVENNGNGHVHTWINLQTALIETAHTTPSSDDIAAVMDWARMGVLSDGNCVVLQTTSTSPAEQEYPEATIGVRAGDGLTETAVLK